MATHYKLLFRGAVHKDQHTSVVRGRLQALLKASDAQTEVMFSGKPVTIKKVVDEPTAERFLDAFAKAGAKLELVEVAAPEPESAPATAEAVDSAAPERDAVVDGTAAFQLAEVGATLVPASARVAAPESTVATDHLSLAVPGTNLGDATDAVAAVPLSVDTAHLQLDQPGVRLGVPAPEPSDIESVLDFDFELGEVGEVLVASTQTPEPELPDLSHLQLESLPVEEPDAEQPA